MSEIRAFLAVDIDDDLKPKINRVMKDFKAIDTKIKYVELSNLHLTLKFFGDIDTNGLKLLEKSITNVLADFKPFTVRISGCGAFPNKNLIKVIWIGLDGDAILKDIHDRLDEEFAKIGIEKDRKFSTHLTIGRMKTGKNKNLVKSAIEEFEDIEIGEMEVKSISLKKSTLTPAGPIYEDLTVFEL